MTENKLNGKIDDLFRREEWAKAYRLLKRQHEKDPENHWVLTQLGVTHYEQRRYKTALRLFLASQKIVPDCPLTLWNLAGTLDALGKHAQAVQIFTWLLQSDVSPADDPCWESTEWTDALKADCVYRLGVCFQRMGKKRKAEECYRQYLNLLLVGSEGAYSIDDVKRQLRGLHGSARPNGAVSDVQKAVQTTLLASGILPRKGRRISLQGLVPGGRSGSKE